MEPSSQCEAKHTLGPWAVISSGLATGITRTGSNSNRAKRRRQALTRRRRCTALPTPPLRTARRSGGRRSSTSSTSRPTSREGPGPGQDLGHPFSCPLGCHLRLCSETPNPDAFAAAGASRPALREAAVTSRRWLTSTRCLRPTGSCPPGSAGATAPGSTTPCSASWTGRVTAELSLPILLCSS